LVTILKEPGMRVPLALTAAFLSALVSNSARAQGNSDAPLVKREAFANAHLLLMARSESRGTARIADVEVWASGNRLRAKIISAGGLPSDEFWLDGLTSDPLMLRAGKVADASRHSLEQGLQLSLRASPELGNSKNDRIAGHPCKVLTEALAGGLTMTRCIWRGLPLSVELSGRNFSFNAAATLVEENRVAVTELQPPPGAPTAAKARFQQTPDTTKPSAA
jgi:hypothetical protein